MKRQVTTTQFMNIHDVMSGKDRSLRARCLRLVAGIAEPFYAAAVTLRNKLYDWGVLRTHRVGLPVISVGNITTGGTGKTPMVIHIAKLLQRHGYRPAVILRGYMTDAGAFSDEAIMLNDALPDVTVVTNADRVRAAQQLATHADVDVVVLDDAFQHRRIHRDVDLVLIDATEPFGFGHVLPRGMLREPIRGLRRAHLAVLTRADRVDDEACRAIEGVVQRHHGEPIGRAAQVWSEIIDTNDQPVDAENRRVFALAAIGNPKQWIEQAGNRFHVVHSLCLPDHHAYDNPRIWNVLAGHDIDAVVTTEKDWVKLRPLLESQPCPVPVWRPRVELRVTRGEDRFEKLILDAVRSHADKSNDVTGSRGGGASATRRQS